MSVLYPGLTHQIGGNTAGATANISSGTYILAGGNNITLSQNGNNVTISGGAGGGGNLSVGMSTGGNTSGTTGLVQSQMVFAGGNNITLSQSVNGNSATLSISAAAVGAGSFSAGMSNIGNTSGTSGTVANQIVFAGGNNITLSQSVNGGSATLTISGGAGGGGNTRSYAYFPDQKTGRNGASLYSTNNYPYFCSAPVQVSGNIIFGRILFSNNSVSSSSNSSYAGSLTFSLGIYTRTSQSLSLASTYTYNMTWSNTSNSYNSLYDGNRQLTVSDMSWSVTPGDYWVGLLLSRSTVGANWVTFNFVNNLLNLSKVADIGASGSNTQSYLFWEGQYSTTTNALPNSCIRNDFITNAGQGSIDLFLATNTVAVS